MTDVQTTTGAQTQDAAGGPARPGTPRRLVLLGAGAVGATAVLAACGTDGSSTNPNGSDFSTDPGPAGSAGPGGGSGNDSGSQGGGSGGDSLASTADIPEGGGIIAGELVITQPVAGTYKAFSKVCTHAGCDVSKVDAGVILCPCHNSKFNIETGEPVSGPASKALPERKIKVDGQNIVAA